MNRPDIPDYVAPPLNEVGLSVQFEIPPNYRNVHARDVWQLFENEFPNIQEHVETQPQFELFGGGPNQNVVFEMPFQVAPRGNLNWFIKEDEIELIQFQKNKFIHNWRKIAGKDNPYPRFEKIVESYSNELNALNALYENLGFGKLIINQCELIYINVIKYNDFKNGGVQEAIFSNNNFEFNVGESEYNFQISKVLTENKSPIGRLYTQVMTGMINAGEPAIHLQFVCRGAPTNIEIGTSLDLITKFRSEIVETFTNMTSKYAHKLWGRKK